MELRLKFGGSAAGVCSARLELPAYLEGSVAERGEWLAGCAPPPRAPPPSGVLLLPSSAPSLLPPSSPSWLLRALPASGGEEAAV